MRRRERFGQHVEIARVPSDTVYADHDVGIVRRAPLEVDDAVKSVRRKPAEMASAGRCLRQHENGFDRANRARQHRAAIVRDRTGSLPELRPVERDEACPLLVEKRRQLVLARHRIDISLSQQRAAESAIEQQIRKQVCARAARAAESP